MTIEEEVHLIIENPAEEATHEVIHEVVEETDQEERQGRIGKVRPQDESLPLKDFQTIQFMPLDLNSQEMMIGILVFGTELNQVNSHPIQEVSNQRHGQHHWDSAVLLALILYPVRLEACITLRLVETFP